MANDQWLYAQLNELAEPNYREFCRRIIPDGMELLGVRMGALRRIARSLAYTEPDGVPPTDAAEDRYHEQRMVRALMIAYAKIDDEQRINRLKFFLPSINNWAICDSLSTSLRQARSEPEMYREFIRTTIGASDPFSARFAIVLLIHHFMHEPWLSKNLRLLETVQSDHYYVKMAVAWASATAYLISPDQIRQWLETSVSDVQIRMMAAQKIRDSQRSRAVHPAP